MALSLRRARLTSRDSRLSVVANQENDWPDDAHPPAGHCQIAPLQNSGSFVYTIGAPSGAIGTFDFEYVRHIRNYVPLSCPGDGNPYHNYPVVYDFLDNFSLVSKQISGPGLATQTWTYQDGGPSGPYYYTASVPWSYNNNAQPYISPDVCSTCSLSKTVTVTSPGDVTKYIFGVQYARNEGQLLGTEVDDLSGHVSRSSANNYISDADALSQPFPNIAGQSLLPNFENPMGNRIRPVKQTVLTQDGDTYTALTEAFDAFAQPTKTKRFNSISGQAAIEEQTAYLNDLPHWVLGLPQQVDNLTTGETESKNVYDLTNVTLSQRWRFGQLVKSYTFDALGQLTSFTDGNNHTTSLSNYKRGEPQLINFPDLTSESLVVDDAGRITSVTDQGGHTASYTYDAMGRIARISYPGGDEQAWYPTTFAYSFVAAAERGIAANHWRRTVITGNASEVTYFDAMLRPLLSDTSIVGSAGSDITTAKGYDWRGQNIFASYPVSGAPDLSILTTGTHQTYDVLGRLTKSQQDSELGVLTTATAYLSGARQQVTDPKGNITTTSYQVFDQPTYDAVTLVQAPGGITQAIVRDLYGNPTSITQSGLYNGTETDSVTKTLTYDSYHRLCRTTEPESGSTALAYDAANNLAWSASGLTIIGTGCGADQVAAAARTTFTYDGMNRLLTIAPPSGTQSTQTTYDALGQVTKAVSGTSIWNGTYNFRGMLTSESLQLTGQNPWTISYIHDAYGHLAAVNYPAGTGTSEAVAYAPDALGRATKVGSYAGSIGYFPNGALAEFTYGNGTGYVAEQNTRQLLSNFTFGTTSTLNLSEDFTYDVNGNITQVTDLAGGPRSKTFGYDALNRLTSATANGLWGTESYTYDPINNLRTRLSAGQTFSYNYDATNKLTDIFNGASPVDSFVYDNRGNVINKNGVSLVFDQKNQLTQIPGYDSYAYDASGRRVSKTPASDGAAIYYFYDHAGQLMYQWEPGTGKATNFIYLGSKLIARNVNYNTRVIGTIDGVVIDGSGNATVNGWACSTGLNQSIGVEVFAGGPSGGGGTRVATATANIASESAVSTACQASGTAYRFAVPLTTAVRTQYTGAPIYMYGDSPVGNGNLVLNQSGTFLIPAPPVSGAPTLTAPASNTTGGYAVGWSAVTGATSYTLQEQINGGSWTTIQSSAATSWTASGKSNGTYGYRVQGCNTSGCGAWSSTANTTVLLPPPTPASISVPATSNGSVTISWAASSTATSYTLQQSLNGGSWVSVYNGTATSTSRTLTVSGSYTFQVNACNTSGCSAYRVSGTVAATLPPASAPSLSVPASNNTGSYTVSWGAVSAATTYTLQEQVNGGSWTTIQATSATSRAISGKSNGTYGYHVQACNTGGCGPWSATGSTVVLQPPAAAPALSVPASSNTGSYTVSWGAVSTATTYTLQEQVNGGSWTTIQSSSATSLAISGKGSGTYGYHVQACNAGGCGPWSATAAIVAAVPIAINGNAYAVGYLIPSGQKGYSTIGFKIVGGTTWQVYSATPAGNVVKLSGALPSGAATVQYTWTYVGIPSGDVDAGGTLTNNASSPVAVSGNPAGYYTTGTFGPTSGSRGRTYQLRVDFYNAAGSNISSSTATMTAETEGSI
ncbi:hypothetical protein [Rhodanobacter sp. OR87]|uniref:hypothetical protein n=1 Tax=Rhodanobacter sp. OR87 TaxID=1076523 RepID=UPI0009DD5D4B|nr:hypothetical protein [Rhodanobacter sp. OR87]